MTKAGSGQAKYESKMLYFVRYLKLTSKLNHHFCTINTTLINRWKAIKTIIIRKKTLNLNKKKEKRTTNKLNESLGAI